MAGPGSRVGAEGDGSAVSVTTDGDRLVVDARQAVLASLLRDAYIQWDEDMVLDWVVRYWQSAKSVGLPVNPDIDAFYRDFEYMALQRHLKILGIFCRLKHRDGKPRYSEDLPRFFAYAHKVASRYGPLRPFLRLLEPLMGASRIEAFY